MLAAPTEERETVTMRKISNGFLVTHSSTRNGKYTETERFEAKRPVLAPSGKAPRGAGRGR
jgi:hypothetical protein